MCIRDRFNHDGSPIDKFRRLMVQARQIYSFSELGRLGWQGDWKSIVENTMPHFLRGINSDDLFIHTFDSQKQIQDARLDLYNQAFGLFALGNAGAVSYTHLDVYKRQGDGRGIIICQRHS